MLLLTSGGLRWESSRMWDATMSHAQTPGSQASPNNNEAERGRACDIDGGAGTAKSMIDPASATPRERQLLTYNAALVQLSRSVAIGQGDVPAAFDEITRIASRALDLERVSIWLYSDDRARIRCQNLFERSGAKHTAGLELKAADYPVYFRAIEENRTIAADDAVRDPRTREFDKTYLLPLKITSMLDAPVRLGGRLIGLVCHEHIGPLRHWTAEEQAFAGSMADFVALVMQAADRRRFQDAVLESERQLRQIIDLVPHMIFVTDRSGRFMLANQAVADAYGTSVERLIGRNHAAVHPSSSEIARMLASSQSVIRTRHPKFLPEQRFTDSTGHTHIVQLTTIPFEDPPSIYPAALSIAIDVTQLKHAQQQQAFMLQELDHRVKNNLAKVLSVAELTIAGSKSLEEFSTAFTGRIHSMAIAHETLASSGWEGAELHELAARILEPHQQRSESAGEAISLDGARVMLPPAIAPPLSMILHELATNAAKYGALSVPNGRVTIDWNTSLEGEQRWLNLHWRETDGPPVTPPSNRGFGTTLIEKTAVFQLRGRAELDFRPAGLVGSISVPLQQPNQGEPEDREGRHEQQIRAELRPQPKGRSSSATMRRKRLATVIGRRAARSRAIDVVPPHHLQPMEDARRDRSAGQGRATYAMARIGYAEGDPRRATRLSFAASSLKRARDLRTALHLDEIYRDLADEERQEQGDSEL